MELTSAKQIFRSHGHVNPVGTPAWECVKAQVREWSATDRGGGGLLEHFGRFVEWAEARRPGDDDLTRALAYFAGRERVPDADELSALRLVALTEPHPHPYDLAVAWASGWRGQTGPTPFVRGQVSERAVLALVEQVESAVRVSVRLLSLQIGLTVVEPDEIVSMASVIAMSLLGACNCGHHLRGCGGSCGRSCCYPDHDLRTWDPGQCHLRPFIDQAVRGTAQRRILGGAFACSMMFRLLQAEGRLLCRTVEWGHCEICERLFEGSRCPAPHRPSTSAVRREPRKNQIIVPASSNAVGHVPMQRWWCAPCRHLHGSASDGYRRAASCPRCGSISTSTKAVWTLATSTRLMAFA